jgi:hypothetical protein
MIDCENSEERRKKDPKDFILRASRQRKNCYESRRTSTKFCWRFVFSVRLLFILEICDVYCKLSSLTVYRSATTLNVKTVSTRLKRSSFFLLSMHISLNNIYTVYGFRRTARGQFERQNFEVFPSSETKYYLLCCTINFFYS